MSGSTACPPPYRLITNRAIPKSQLEIWQLVPVLAASGQEALDILAADDQFDLMLSDMQMPKMDGIQATRIIRNSANSQRIIIA